MANTDAPFGLRPVRHYFGGVVRTNEYRIEGGLASNIFRGSTVQLVGTNKRIDIAAAGDAPFIGVFDGCQYEDAQGNIVYSSYWPTGQTVKTGSVVKAFVYDDPNILFEIQCDADLVEADIGAHADVTAESGDTTTGNSTQELNSADIGTGENLHIVDYVRDGSNEVGSNFTRALVLINEHVLRSTITEVAQPWPS